MTKRIVELKKIQDVVSFLEEIGEAPVLLWEPLDLENTVVITAGIDSDLLVSCAVSKQEFESWRDDNAAPVTVLEGRISFQ